MRAITLMAVMFLAATAAGFGQSARRPVSTEKGPQRTNTATAPERPVAPGIEATGVETTGVNDAMVQSAVESYRRSWNRMPEKTRKMMLSHGGFTPEQYERKMRQSLAPAPAGLFATPNHFVPSTPSAPVAPNGGMNSADSGRELNTNVLNSMKTSDQDLNTIRDGNLQRVQKGACAPEIALRIVELKSRVAAAENALREHATGIPAAATPRDSVSQQLDSVLGPAGRETVESPASADQRRKQTEAEITSAQAELDGLASACVSRREK